MGNMNIDLHKLRSSTDSEDGSELKDPGGFEVDAAGDNIPRWLKTRERSQGLFKKPLLVIALIACAFLILISLALHRRNQTPAGAPQTVGTADPPRRAVVLASYSKQDVSWLGKLRPEWKYYRYGMDYEQTRYKDKWGTPLSVPANLGRESMAYLTFIIDHYDALPEYMVFVHGHERAWHQPLDITWKLDALNLSAVKQYGYVSLHCLYDPICDEDKMLDLSKGPYEFPEDDRLWNSIRPLPAWWKYNFGSDDLSENDLPTKYSSIGGGQFAVSRETILKHPLEYWKAFRKPMESLENLKEFDSKLRDISIEMWGLRGHHTRETIFGTAKRHTVDTWVMGGFFEKSWVQVILGEQVWCVKPQRCDAEHFGNAIVCIANKSKPRWTYKCAKHNANMQKMVAYNKAFLDSV